MTSFLKIKKTHLILLAVIFIISLGIRMTLLEKRWINPDEGAHLMDAVLLMDGKIPVVDFQSRQPFYVYLMAIFLKVFGTSYLSGRLLPLTCSMLVGIMVFFVARALFDENVAVMSSALYWMLPLEVINSTVVKTEPLVALLACLSLYGLIRYWKSERAAWLVGAGFFAALGYYARQSSLTIVLSSLVFMALLHRGKIRETVKSVAYYTAGYLAVVLTVMTYYSRYMPLDKLLTSFQISPFGTVFKTAYRIVYRYELASRPEAAVFQSSGNNALFFTYIRDAIELHSFLFIGMLFSIVALGLSLFFSANRKVSREGLLSWVFLYLWVFSLFAGYAAYFASRGFFIDYFREFLPPLVIIFSAWVLQSLPRTVTDPEKITQRLILGGLPLLGILFFFQANHRDFSGKGFYASIAIAVVALFTFIGSFESSTRRIYFALSLLAILVFILVPRQTVFKDSLQGPIPSLGMIGVIYGITWAYMNGKVRTALGDYVRFVGLSIATAALVVSVSYSALLLTVSYDTPWSPQALKNVADYIRTHTRPGDEVVSGAVIWEFQGLRRPLHLYSHPLRFEHPLPADEQKAIQLAVETDPPKVVVLDGYTEKTYFRQVPSMPELLKEKYELVITEGTPQNPIRVYQLKDKPV